MKMTLVMPNEAKTARFRKRGKVINHLIEHGAKHVRDGASFHHVSQCVTVEAATQAVKLSPIELQDEVLKPLESMVIKRNRASLFNY